MGSPEIRFPRLYAAASLKPILKGTPAFCAAAFSAALCRGLIEAAVRAAKGQENVRGFPRLYAAASLKLPFCSASFMPDISFPRLYAAASLKHQNGRIAYALVTGFSAALCRGLIEAPFEKISISL